MLVLIAVLIVATAAQARPSLLDNRVVGGFEAEPCQFPYQAGIYLKRTDGLVFFCGGSLITRDTVLTAAHCVEGVQKAEVILGAHRIKEKEPTQVRVNSSNFIIHPNYTRASLLNDVALIKFPIKIILNKYIDIVPLPLSSVDLYTDDIAVVSGWGIDADNSTTLSPVLRYTSNPVISNLNCSNFYSSAIKDSHLCVSGEGGKSACNGDSGGPLITAINGISHQIGIVSFGSSSGCETGYPAVYTRVTSHLDWINQNV